MAQAVTVQSGDTVSHLLKRHRRLQDSEISLWLPKVRRINPHISNLNLIHPRDKVLLPDRLDEMVPDSRIWQNAFSSIPPVLTHKAQDGQLMHLCIGGESIDDVARLMFADTPHFHILPSTKRAVLIHNNPFLRDHLAGNRIPHGMLVDITPKRFSDMDHHFWNSQRSYISVAWNELHEKSKHVVHDTGPEGGLALADLVRRLKEVGAGVGMDDTVRFAGYGVAGVSGYSASGQMALGNTQALARELYEEAVAKFGKQAVLSKSKTSIVKMQRFLTGHPKYPQLMQSLKELPEHLLPKGRRIPNPRSASSNAAARHFRKAFSLPYDKWSSSRYFSTIGRQLNGKVSLLKGLGRHATWYIPAAIGIYNTLQAPPEMQLLAAFGEGFGIIGGYAGTVLGGSFLATGVLGISAFFGLCLGPFGIFITVFICAAAGGLALSEGGKWIGQRIYDVGSKLTNQIYYSADELAGAF